MTGIAPPSPHEEDWLLQQLDARPWRDAVAAAFADSRPELFALISDAGQAAIFSLLDIEPGCRCLDATGGWGQLAIPLAARARVTAFAPSAVRAAILHRIAADEGVDLALAVGSLASCPFAPGTFDVVVADELPLRAAATVVQGAVAVMRTAAALLRPGGTMYLGAANDLALAKIAGGDAGSWTLARYGELFAAAGLAVVATYACFPDHERPQCFVPLSLVDDFVCGAPPLSLLDIGQSARFGAPHSGLAAEGIARHLVPSFAFILCRMDQQ